MKHFILRNIDVIMLNTILLFYLEIPINSMKFWVSVFCISTCMALATHYNTKNGQDKNI